MSTSTRRKLRLRQETFGKAYFETGNYASYAERGPRYERMAAELYSHITHNYTQSVRSWLDFGCGYGFLVKGLNVSGAIRAVGYDISEHAKREAVTLGVPLIDYAKERFNVITALDVFEHMTDDQIKDACTTFKCGYLVVRIPCALEGEKAFHLEVSRKDPTHINCKTSREWIAFFDDLGYRIMERLQLFTIYDSPGVFCAVFG